MLYSYVPQTRVDRKFRGFKRGREFAGGRRAGLGERDLEVDLEVDRQRRRRQVNGGDREQAQEQERGGFV